jgi:uncharacterized protein YyaL (SSP411 family)
MPNRLAEATSPYLLQHKDNPVDWYPWGEEAFEKARAENKPVFLSVGYSSCHWCHVMEHESFEDEEVAHLLNTHFVSVKVDREERPDLDDTFMTAVQLSSGRGGWPMTIFMTPERKPFFAGTYFPKKDRDQHPGLITIAGQIALGWHSKKSEFMKAAEDFAKALSQSLSREAPKTFAKVDQKLIEDAVKALAGQFDAEHGGFGAAPKFPPHSSISFLLQFAATQEGRDDLAQAALSMSLATLEMMALGGIHDHVGGGFHRYSTDPEWLLPHFEKMLYDNALMLGNLSYAIGVTGQAAPHLSKVLMDAAIGIVEWLVSHMRGPNGLFYSAVDADSEGEEGKYYVWTASEVQEVLGERAEPFTRAYSFAEEGNYHDEASGALSGKNIPHLKEPPSEGFHEELNLLLQRRLKRVPPSLDDKQLVGWNGFVITGLSMLGQFAIAEGAAKAILDAEKAFGRLPHQIAKGIPSGDAFLDDYAAFICSLLDLADSGSAQSTTWRAEAERLTLEMVERFYDRENEGFFFTSASHEMLFGRNKPVFDQPWPSGNALAIQALIRTGDLERAEKCLNAFAGWMERVPQATEAMLIAAMWYLEMSNAEVPAAAPAAAPSSPVQAEVRVELRPKEIVAGADGKCRGTVHITIPEGLHINSNQPPARWLTPTALRFEPLKAEVDYPAGETYEGEVEIPFTVSLPAGERGADFEVVVTYQACTGQECFLPQEKRLTGVALRG